MGISRRRSVGADGSVTNHTGGLYKIKIEGRLDEHWLSWFEGMTLRCVKNRRTGLEVTELRGAFADQPALHGILTKIRDLNLTLISVTRLDPADSARRKTPSRRPQRRAQLE